MLYHKLIGFPVTLLLDTVYHRLVSYTQHAINEAKKDRYGDIVLLKVIKFKREDIIEVETSDNINADKVLIRIPYNEKYDICLAILLKVSLVKTLWLNDKKDSHKTLDKNKYDKLLK